MWVKRLEEELFRQGDRERAAKMPVSPLMDRWVHGGMGCRILMWHAASLQLALGHAYGNYVCGAICVIITRQMQGTHLPLVV